LNVPPKILVTGESRLLIELTPRFKYMTSYNNGNKETLHEIRKMIEDSEIYKQIMKTYKKNNKNNQKYFLKSPLFFLKIHIKKKNGTGGYEPKQLMKKGTGPVVLIDSKEMKETTELVLGGSAFADRYKLYDYLNDLSIKISAGVADLVISRAGSTIFEIASWGKPSILIPITESNNDHQRKNAFSYARTGAGVVIEENNLTSEILLAQIQTLMSDTLKREKMKLAAHSFAKHDAAKTIADAIIGLALDHEQ
jgi:hypothetical protein